MSISYSNEGVPYLQDSILFNMGKYLPYMAQANVELSVSFYADQYGIIVHHFVPPYSPERLTFKTIWDATEAFLDQALSFFELEYVFIIEYEAYGNKNSTYAFKVE